LGDNFINVLSEEDVAGYAHGHISAALIAAQIADPLSYFYLCGPDPMMLAVEKDLSSLGIADERIVKEAF
jgi:ferredoxin-NADP reductase